ncbi:MAG: class I SAM-dependent DNA methyltransferase [Gemmatimonadaceae bacterium]
MSRLRTAAHYDRAYFDKWYRHPHHRVKSAKYLARQASFVIGVAEYLLDRRVTSVLDVGAGEGHWRPVLRRLRPGIRYYGVDPSEYAVRRYGRRRNIQLGSLGTLTRLRLPAGFDLILCCGVLNYVAGGEVVAGLRTLRGLARGPLYLEIFAREDDAEGDFRRQDAQREAWYRAAVEEAGLIACGLQFYLPREYKNLTSALERCGP